MCIRDRPPHGLEPVTPRAELHDALRGALRRARQQVMRAPADLHALLADLLRGERPLSISGQLRAC
eukprot:8358783-Pyramimonas_sp.AAC.1